uniref:Serine/threonine-protein phosphatase n=1 Tax=Pristionchus pacificus TaxID=54126 RepID=A0A2A6C1W7_PRIPA|eukprot:PDM72021.1 Calcineurin-like phosphoesterase [Pristionchus pacificus]
MPTRAKGEVLHEYIVTGRKLPTEKEPVTPIYKMQIFASNTIIAKSHFWYFISMLRRLKKANREILECRRAHLFSPLTPPLLSPSTFLAHCPHSIRRLPDMVEALKKLTRKDYNKYVVDTMGEQYGVQVVRTPPYMAEYAPIEFGWSAMKRAQHDLITHTDDGKKRIEEGALTFCPSLSTEEIVAASDEIIDEADPQPVEDLEELLYMNDTKSANSGTGPTKQSPKKKVVIETGPKKRTGKGLWEFIKAMSSQRYWDEYFNYKVNDIIRTITKVREIFMKEKMLVECGLPVVIMGDLHGQVLGKNSLEVLMMLFCLKIQCPKSFFLLRGNHEARAINRVYGFQQELMERFDRDDARELFIKFNEVFSHMPIACLIGQSILCMHGGISPLLNSLDDIRNIPKPMMDPNSNQLACDLMWADPMIGLKGHRPNMIRGVSIHFGEDLLDEVMKRCDLRLVVRGHQMMMNGFNFFHDKKLVTVFTAASYYPDRPNHGAVMHINKDGRIGFKIIAPLESADGKVFRGAHDDANEYDTGYQTCTDQPKKSSKGGSSKSLKKGDASKKGAAPPPAPAAGLVLERVDSEKKGSEKPPA